MLALQYLEGAGRLRILTAGLDAISQISNLCQQAVDYKSHLLGKIIKNCRVRTLRGRASARRKSCYPNELRTAPLSNHGKLSEMSRQCPRLRWVRDMLDRPDRSAHRNAHDLHSLVNPGVPTATAQSLQRGSRLRRRQIMQ